ncbi:peptidylprolyl isomerase [Spirochaetota bacterium]
MVIEKNRVVAIDYVLKDNDGLEMDSSDGTPLLYLHGNGNLIPGLEKQLEGKKTGDKLHCVIAPEDAYGLRDEEMVFTVSRNDFAEAETIELGMQFHAPHEGGVSVVTVTGIDGDKISLDANHPLAGKTLHFDVSVSDIREASAEELQHGHVHGAHAHEDDDCGCGCSGSCDDDDDCGCSGGCGNCH